METCEYCQTDDALQKGDELLTFDESADLEGYIYILNSGSLVVDNDYSRTQIEINYCPICGRKWNEVAE